MELLSPDFVSFLSALAAIVVIDLMLAGDNAIMIALAARNVPKHLQRRVILWGTAGAIAVRVAMTLVVVWLLKIPGLAAAGGLLLVWIAYRLLAQTDTNEERPVHTVDGFWGAMRIIVVADAVMGLDNVLGVAGAAQGSWVLVTLGLLISIPIVVWGSSLMLRWIQRFPVIIYLGAGVLAWTAAMMIVGEPLIQDHLAEQPALRWIIYAAAIGGVIGVGLSATAPRSGRGTPGGGRMRKEVTRCSGSWFRSTGRPIRSMRSSTRSGSAGCGPMRSCTWSTSSRFSIVTSHVSSRARRSTKSAHAGAQRHSLQPARWPSRPASRSYAE